MRFHSVIITVLLSVSLTLPALAAGPYVGGNYTQLKYADENDDNPGNDIDTEPTAGYLRLGIQPAEYIGIEARGGLGIKDDERDNYRVELDEFYGGYLTLGVPINDAVRPYVIGGYTKARVTERYDGPFSSVISNKETRNNEGESLGAGLDVALTDTVALNLEYMRYLDKDELEMNGLSLGVRSAF